MEGVRVTFHIWGSADTEYVKSTASELQEGYHDSGGGRWLSFTCRTVHNILFFATAVNAARP
jgi:hypothetical protein